MPICTCSKKPRSAITAASATIGPIIPPSLPMIIYGVMLWGVGLGGGYMLAFGNPIMGEPMGVILVYPINRLS